MNIPSKREVLAVAWGFNTGGQLREGHVKRAIRSFGIEPTNSRVQAVMGPSLHWH